MVRLSLRNSAQFVIAFVLLACTSATSDTTVSSTATASGSGGSTVATGGNGGQGGAAGGSGGSGGTTTGTGGSAGESTDANNLPDVPISDGASSGDEPADGGISDASDVDGPRRADADAKDASGSRDADAHAGDAGSRRVQIMPLGDSITYGSAGTNGGYRGPLYALLKTLPTKVLFVGSSDGASVTTTVDPLPTDQRHNEGHPSYNIEDIDHNLDGLDTATFDMYGGASRDPNGGHWLDGIKGDAHARPPLYPDIIIMMIGTNNVRDPDGGAVRNELHALMTKITTLRPDAKLIVAQITPSDRPNNERYNADVASEVKLFQAAGRHVTMVDMFTNFPSDGLSGDNTHPNDKGYAFMAKQWYDGIVAVLPP